MRRTLPAPGTLYILAALVAAPAATPRAASSAAGSEADGGPPAKVLFGGVSRPADGRPEALGAYAKGCLAGAASLPADGPGWQVMRPSRNRSWGHPALVAFLERLAAETRRDGWPGLLVGDMAQPRGGPMATGHASHQTGLDADIWLTPSPGRRLSAEERERLGAPSMLSPGTLEVDPARFGQAQAALIRWTASSAEVARVFVHPGIKRALCLGSAADGDGDRAWLAKVRPWWGHDTHLHVRLHCPPAEAACLDQQALPPGDGCGAELDWWFTEEPWRRSTAPPPAPVTLADLPARCRAVLEE